MGKSNQENITKWSIIEANEIKFQFLTKDMFFCLMVLWYFNQEGMGKLLGSQESGDLHWALDFFAPLM